jgi:anti-sigma regulatory factor (Ser/Thr protein kinase)
MTSQMSSTETGRAVRIATSRSRRAGCAPLTGPSVGAAVNVDGLQIPARVSVARRFGRGSPAIRSRHHHPPARSHAPGRARVSPASHATGTTRLRRRSRDFLAGTGAGHHCQQVAELLVSELVTNAVTHARTTAGLSVSVTGSTARIEVTDDGPGQPELRDPDPGHGGYGLWLVDWLARSWGVNTGNGQDKTVWFTLLLFRLQLPDARPLPPPQLVCDLPEHPLRPPPGHPSNHGPAEQVQPGTHPFSHRGHLTSELAARAGHYPAHRCCLAHGRLAATRGAAPRTSAVLGPVQPAAAGAGTAHLRGPAARKPGSQEAPERSGTGGLIQDDGQRTWKLASLLILERRRTTQQDKPASKPHEDQIEQTQRHGRSLCPTATPHLSRQVTAIGRLLAPHRASSRSAQAPHCSCAAPSGPDRPAFASRPAPPSPGTPRQADHHHDSPAPDPVRHPARRGLGHLT